MIDYTLIFQIKYPNSSWSLNGDSYEGLTWYSDSHKPTKEELDSQWDEVLSIKKKENCKDKAKQLLAQSDWSTLPDVQTQLSNYQDFVNYRSQLRNLVINPVENPVFPSEPEARWK
jgi:hypothetical protein